MTGALRVRAPGRPLRGEVAVPGDKSIAHRALLLGALADGRSVVRGLPGGADVRATLGAIRALGARVVDEGGAIAIDGRGPDLGRDRRTAIDCANSGTTMRLTAGLVAACPGTHELDGDASLRRRPMERVAEPLRRMGATVETTDGHAPLRVVGAAARAIEWTLPVASAQVKSAILLAGLRARGRTTVVEPLATRDHTERMLRAMGVAVASEAGRVSVDGGARLRPLTIDLPGDPSSAAFLVVAASLVAGSEVRVRRVGVNPLRTGSFALLRRMGGDVRTVATRDEAGEPCGDVVARAAALAGTAIRPEEVPAAIDELPVLAVAAACADGETRVAGAGELRLKESDRVAALAQLGDLGVPFESTADGFVVRGARDRELGGGRIVTGGDHRIAMAFAVAGLRSREGVVIDDPGCVDVSFPGFFDHLTHLGAIVERA